MTSKSFHSDKQCKKCGSFERYKSSNRCVACARSYQKKKYRSDAKETVRLDAQQKCKEALSDGLVTYESITSCKNCDSNIRYVSSNACQKCTKEKSKEYRATKALNAEEELRKQQEKNTMGMLSRVSSTCFVQNAENFMAKRVLEPSDFEHSSEYNDYRNSDNYTRALKLIAIQEQLKLSPNNKQLQQQEFALKFILGKIEASDSAFKKFIEVTEYLNENNASV